MRLQVLLQGPIISRKQQSTIHKLWCASTNPLNRKTKLLTLSGSVPFLDGAVHHQDAHTKHRSTLSSLVNLLGIPQGVVALLPTLLLQRLFTWGTLLHAAVFSPFSVCVTLSRG